MIDTMIFQWRWWLHRHRTASIVNATTQLQAIGWTDHRAPAILFKPTSKKVTIVNSVVIIIVTDVIDCAPLTPTFLPKKPETIDPNKGKVIIARYIIYILLRCFLLIYKMQLEYLNQWLIPHQLLLLYI
jgi:hypothetical protein